MARTRARRPGRRLALGLGGLALVATSAVAASTPAHAPTDVTGTTAAAVAATTPDAPATTEGATTPASALGSTTSLSTTTGPPPAPTALPVPAALAPAGLGPRDGPVPVPIELRLPTIDLAAEVLGVGISDADAMDAPTGPVGDPIWEQAYWYRGSAVPGAASTAVIAGHVGGARGGPGTFERLDELAVGDPIVVHDHRTDLDVRFTVTEVVTYTLAEAAEPLALARLYGTGPVDGLPPQPSLDGLGHLTLVTCAGTFRGTTHDQRLAVYATRTA